MRGKLVPQVGDPHSGSGRSVQHPDTVLCCDLTPVVGSRAVFACNLLLIRVRTGFSAALQHWFMLNV